MDLRGDYVLSFDAEIFRRRQQMPIIRVDNAETGLGRRRQMNGISRPQKDGAWELPIASRPIRWNISRSGASQ